MDVLQHAVGIVRRLDAEVAAVLFVPGGGQIGHAKIIVEQRLLQFESHEDVEVIGHFVGLGADQRGPHVVDCEIEVVERDIGERFVEGRLGKWIEVLPETAAAADQIFPHPRLRFVDAERDGFAGGETVAFFGQALVVDAVARFVQDAEEAAGEIVLVVARGEAGVVRSEAAAEGMMGDVEPAGLEIEADRFGGLRPNDFCNSMGKRRLRISVFGRRGLAAISATSGTSSSRRAARTWRTSEVRAPGS